MENSKDIRTISVVLLGYASYRLLQEFFASDLVNWIYTQIPIQSIAVLMTYAILAIPLFVGAAMLYPQVSLGQKLGWSSRPWTGLMTGALLTLPMALGYLVLYSIQTPIHWDVVIKNSLVAALSEEFIFRAFFFGLLFRYSRLGFLPSLLLGALFFALGHLYQTDDPGRAAMIFLTTFAASGWFAWLYAEWRFNLLLIVSLHAFMNLYWALFGAGMDAAGNLKANIFRGAVIALSILLTLYLKRRKGDKLEVNSRTLWVKQVV